ncbi:MAG: hypothetical protein PHQ03_02005 [Methylococcales bacterium]|nr:hypothetical protein [Methylococcales bacterium]
MKQLFCVLCLIGTTTVVYAENDFMIKLMEERFKNADKNSDNQITLEEAENGMPRVAAHFDVIDVDKNGYASLEEIKAAMAKL